MTERHPAHRNTSTLSFAGCSGGRRRRGRTGAAAVAVMKVLFPHMFMEERYAVPPREAPGIRPDRE